MGARRSSARYRAGYGTERGHCSRARHPDPRPSLNALKYQCRIADRNMRINILLMAESTGDRTATVVATLRLPTDGTPVATLAPAPLLLRRVAPATSTYAPALGARAHVAISDGAAVAVEHTAAQLP